MTRDIRQLLIALAIVVCAAIPAQRALALDLRNITLQQSTDCSQSDDPKCVDQCHNINIGNAVSALKSGYLKQLAANIGQDLAHRALEFAAKLVLCTVIPDKGVNVGLFGTGYTLTYKGPNCATVTDNATVNIFSTIKQQAVDTLQNSFLSTCAADGMRKQVEDNVHAMIQQNGPDGGQAFVSDWTSLPASEDRRGVNRFFAILVNTPICSYFRDDIYAYYGVPQNYIDNPPSIDKDGFAVSAGDPLTVRGACTLPDGLTPQALDANWTANGGFVAMALLNQPQNNYAGFKNMADAELDAQRSATVTGATNEALAGGGFRGFYASCVRSDAAGHCLQQTVTQPAGGVEAAQAAIYSSNFNLIATSKDSNSLVGPVGARLSSRILSLDNDPLNYDPRLDGSSRNYVNIGNGTAQPTIVDAPANPTDPADLACTNNRPQCTCVQNNPDYQGLGQQLVPAEQEALGGLFGPSISSDGVHINPGQEVFFLIRVCDTDIGKALNCSVQASANPRGVVLDLQAITVSFDLIAPNGVIRMPGQAVAVCPIGAQ